MYFKEQEVLLRVLRQHEAFLRVLKDHDMFPSSMEEHEEVLQVLKEYHVLFRVSKEDGLFLHKYGLFPLKNEQLGFLRGYAHVKKSEVRLSKKRPSAVR